MASVYLNFIRPDREGFIKLHIFESVSKDGPFNEIEEVVNIGVFPDYISEYSTNLADSVVDWFAIQWEDDKGVRTDMSSPIQGGTTNLVAIIAERVQLRDPSVNEAVAVQEAEAVIESFFDADPYTIDPTTVKFSILSGLTLLTLARSYLMGVYAQSSATSWTAGIVGIQKSAASVRTLDDIKKLVAESNTLLGRSYSVVLLLKEIEVAGGFRRLAGVDLSRSIFELQ